MTCFCPIHAVGNGSRGICVNAECIFGYKNLCNADATTNCIYCRVHPLGTIQKRETKKQRTDNNNNQVKLIDFLFKIPKGNSN